MPLGRQGEDLVAAYYRKLGFTVLDKNYIFPRGKQMGELDLVVKKGNELVFVEVKTRRSSRFGSAAEAVDFRKQSRLVRTAKLYLQQHPQLQQCDYRIDVATVDIDNLNESVIIIPNAIEDLD